MNTDSRNAPTHSGEQTPLLSIRDLHTSYGAIEALHGISLDVYPGEVVSLLGANGAGKTTTLMSISGIQPCRAQTLQFAGIDLRSMPAHLRVELGLAHVPEGRRIFPRLTVHDNMMLGAYLRTDAAVMRRNEERVYTLFPILKERRTQLGGTLSGGEQQMLAIGRALMSEPRMLLLDEPSMGIAPLLVQKIFATLRELHAQGMTILLIEQNAHLALKLSQRAYVLETGSIILSGSADELSSDARVKEAYLGA
jgi:branched-chain amino acid transport system ATP-binding protein